MKKVLLFVLTLSISLIACQKNVDTNTTNTVTKKIKKIQEIETEYGRGWTYNFYYDSKDNLTKVIEISDNFQPNAIWHDTSEVVTISYSNNFPKIVSIVKYKGLILKNTFTRQYTYNNSNQIIHDSLVSFNLQYPDYYSGANYKDSIQDFTNRKYSYATDVQYKEFYNSPLLNKPYLWERDTAYYTNGNVTKFIGVTYRFNTNKTYNLLTTYTSYNNPLNFALLPMYNPTKNLVNTEIHTYGDYNATSTYHYTFDSASNLIKSIVNTTNATGTSESSYILYEYY